jgi:polyribonucleotide nucleotidyltransferase
VGATYPGRVVNITKFGAFVNILPGRDGLLHISKLGGGKRIDRVEDVVQLGDEIEVKVDDIDPNGKVSLSLVGDAPEGAGSGSSGGGRGNSSDAGSDGDAGDREYVSFEDAFDQEVKGEFGDLGPESSSGGGERGRGGDRGRGNGRGRSGGSRRRR